MAFSFGFAGDDIDIDDNDLSNESPIDNSAQQTSNSLPELVKANKHNMDEWLSILPSQIYYNRLAISGTQITIARREIFDIRTQLMAEDNEGHDNEELIFGLEEGDLKPNFYEGGFKTWECALDLAKLVTSEIPSAQSEESQTATTSHIIELGAGTAVPSLALFAYALSQTGRAENGVPTRKTHFTFADYNESVLRLVTLPNLILTWHIMQSQTAVSEVAENQDAPTTATTQDEELDITPELLDSFKADLTRRGISLEFISGAWSPKFVDLVFSSSNDTARQTMVLASETIYSPLSLAAFSETLLELLRRSSTASTKAKALVAAKKVYFGVGGGVDEFLATLKNVCADELDVQQKVNVQSEGVGRVVLEITPVVNGV